MNKIILSSLVAFAVTLPAIAATSAEWNTSGAKKDYMEEDKSYTGAAIYDHLGVYTNTDSSPVDAIPEYSLVAGYYLPMLSYSAQPCPAGRYCAGGGVYTYSTTSDQGINGLISAGYYSTGGATSETPTSCVGTGNTCGSCATNAIGATSVAGATTITECYRTGTISCSSVFPVSTYPSNQTDNNYVGLVRGTGYYNTTGNLLINSHDNPTDTTNDSWSAASAAVACTSHLKSDGTAGDCIPDSPKSCLVRDVSCSTGYHSSKTSAMSGSALANAVPNGTSTSSNSGVVIDYNSDSSGGTFSIDYDNNVSVKGVWMRGTNVGTGQLAYNPTSSNCYCQIQSLTDSNSTSKPIISNWFTQNNGNTPCAETCVNYIKNLNAAVTGDSSHETLVGLYEYRCELDNNKVLLFANGGSGKIANTTVTDDVAVQATCTTNAAIKGIIPWNVSNSASTNTLTKSNSVFLGWSDNSNCTSTNCLTEAKCQTQNETPYYAVWGSATCTAGTGVNTISLNGITQNRPSCNVSCNANYYSLTPVSLIEWAGEAEVTVACAACETNWSSDAGSTVHSDCHRTVTLNKNGGSGTVQGTTGTTNASITCSYGIACNFGSANLTENGQTFTGGWGITPDCKDTDTSATITSIEANVTYYACKSANTIYIRWTGVKTVPAGFSEISNDTAISTVSYGGDILTPTEAITTTGQTFLGWKFVKPAQ